MDEDVVTKIDKHLFVDGKRADKIVIPADGKIHRVLEIWSPAIGYVGDEPFKGHARVIFSGPGKLTQDELNELTK